MAARYIHWYLSLDSIVLTYLLIVCACVYLSQHVHAVDLPLEVRGQPCGVSFLLPHVDPED